MKRAIQRIGSVLRIAGRAYGTDKVPRLSASLAYYCVLSLAPLLILSVAVAGLVFGHEAARGEVAQQFDALLGPKGGAAIRAALASDYLHGRSAAGLVVGIVVLLFSASGVFGALQDALDTIWKVKPRPGRGVWGFLRDRFFSFTMVLAVAFLLLVSLVISAALSAMGAWFSQRLPGGATLWHIVNFVVSLGLITGLFALTFKVVPDVEMRWRDVWRGGLITAALFVVGKLLIGLYLGRSSTTSLFGAAGSLLVVVIWVYYSAQILLAGAELTRAYAEVRGAPQTPSENAVSVSPEERARMVPTAQPR